MFTLSAGLAISPVRGLMQPYPAEAIGLWPISTRVHKPENGDLSILDSVNWPNAG